MNQQYIVQQYVLLRGFVPAQVEHLSARYRIARSRIITEGIELGFRLGDIKLNGKLVLASKNSAIAPLSLSNPPELISPQWIDYNNENWMSIDITNAYDTLNNFAKRFNRLPKEQAHAVGFVDASFRNYIVAKSTELEGGELTLIGRNHTSRKISLQEILDHKHRG